MNRWLRRAGYLAGGIVALLLVTAAGVYGVSEVRYRKHYDVAEAPVAVPTDSAAIARGEHLANSFAACADCHGANLGGKVVFDDPPIGRVYALNLTSGKGGVGGTLSDVDLARAIRHGVAPDGRPLKVMPSSDYMALSDADLGAIIAYVRSRPPVDNTVPSPSVGPVGRALYLAGMLPFLHAERIDHAQKHVASVTPGVTVAYGEYIATVGCKGCHGPALAGGKIVGGAPDWPPAANLTPTGATKGWSEADFRNLLRTGKRPNGTPVNDVMPWRMARNMSDEEISALFLYLRSLKGV